MHPQTLRRGSLLLGLLLAPLTPAFSQTNTVLEMTTSVLDHPTGSGISGNASQVALGRYSDDAIPDAAVLHGSKVHFAYGVDRRNVWSNVTGDYTSIVRLPAFVSGSGRDAVIASTGTGLAVLTWDGSVGVRTLVPSTLSGNPSWANAWANATDLQVFAHHSGVYELVGLAASATSLLRTTWNPTTAQFTSMTSLTVASGTTALAPLQWDLDSDAEYATASSTGLVVHDHSGASMTSVAEASSDPILAAVMDAGVPHRLAWMRSVVAGNEQLNVVLSSGVQEPAHVYYGANVSHLALIDLGGVDTRKELWMTSNGLALGVGLCRGTQETFVNWPASGAFLVDLDRAQTAIVPPELPLAGPGSGVYGGANTAPVPAVMDIDGDSDEDLFLAGHPGQADRAMVCLGKVFNEENDILNPRRVKPWMIEYSFQISGAPSGPQSALSEFDLPTKPTLGPASGATHVRYAVWSQDVNHTNVTLVHALDVPLSPPNPPPPTITVPNVDLLQNGALLHLEVSYLEFNGSLMTATRPALLETLVLDKSELGLQLFQDRVWLAGTDSGVGTSGSTARPPISPPTGGTTP